MNKGTIQNIINIKKERIRHTVFRNILNIFLMLIYENCIIRKHRSRKK